MNPESVRVRVEDEAGRLPPGTEFRFAIEGELLHLRYLRLSRKGRGDGTRFLAAILDICDREGVVAVLTADPTDQPGDPGLLDLVRWYQRLGFEPEGTFHDEGIQMRRAPRVDRSASILEAYAASKGGGMSSEALNEIIEKALLNEGDIAVSPSSYGL